MSKVYVIADCSGSMAELGKDGIVEYLLRCTANMLSAADLEFYSWGSTIEKLGTDSFDEPDLIKFSGKSDVGLLEEMLGEMDEGTPVLLLSDGNFEYKRIRKKAEEKKLAVIGIVIGADAYPLAMNSVSILQRAYKAEDIAAAAALLRSYIQQEDEQLCE